MGEYFFYIKNMKENFKDYILSQTDNNYKKWYSWGLLQGTDLDVKQLELIANCFEYIYNVLKLDIEKIMIDDVKFDIFIFPITFRIFKHWPINKLDYLNQVDHLMDDLRFKYEEGIKQLYHLHNGVDYIDYEAQFCAEYSKNYVDKYINYEKNN